MVSIVITAETFGRTYEGSLLRDYFIKSFYLVWTTPKISAPTNFVALQN